MRSAASNELTITVSKRLSLILIPRARALFTTTKSYSGGTIPVATIQLYTRFYSSFIGLSALFIECNSIALKPRARAAATIP